MEMDREILFKAKRKDNGKWVEGYYIYHIKRIICPFGDSIKPEDEQHVIMQDGFSDWNMPRNTVVYEIDPETLCQYTGLTDKNGQKIWENDIVKFNDEIWDSCYTSCGTEYDSWEAENYGLVGYCDYSARYDFTKYKYNESPIEADLHENHDIEFSEFVKAHEVAGNIFDNPELMEAE